MPAAANLQTELSDEGVVKALAEVNSAAEIWSSAMARDGGGDDATGEVFQARSQLTQKVSHLYSAIKGPVDMIHDHLEKFSHTGAVRTLLAMGVFEELPGDGKSKTAQQLSDALRVEKQLLIRLMRIATAIGPFAEVGNEEYAHTEFSKAYLGPGLRGFFAMAIDEHMAVLSSFHRYFRENGFRVPTSPNDNPYTFHFQTGGVPIFEWMARYPDRLKNFNMAMTTGSEQGTQSIKLFPWKQELTRYSTDSNTPLVVDVGGGRGHASQVIRDELEEIPGRVILQDQVGAIKEIENQLPNVEKMAHDFFQPQPVQGALVYFLRRVLHDWSDEVSIIILGHIAKAMTADSRIVINEFLVPEVGADPEACWVDLVMMSFAGTERTTSQFKSLLDAAGLKLTKVYSSKKTHYVAVEAKLKGV